MYIYVCVCVSIHLLKEFTEGIGPLIMEINRLTSPRSAGELINSRPTEPTVQLEAKAGSLKIQEEPRCLGSIQKERKTATVPS